MKESNIMTSQVLNRNDINMLLKDFLTRKFDNLDILEKEMICIPVGWWLEEKDLEYIIYKVLLIFFLFLNKNNIYIYYGNMMK